jgi:uncharacterized protein HemX
MADEGGAADPLQDLLAQVEGLATDIRTVHERLDEMITALNDHIDQLDLAQTVTRTTLDTLVARLDAMHTTIMELQKDYGSDSEQDDRDSRSRALRVPRRPSNDFFLRLNLKLHLLMANMILLRILIGT